MNEQQITLVQQSFNQVAPIAGIAALFYRRLFELDPTLRPLFKSDLKKQGTKLMAAITLVVTGLDRPQQILPAVQHLGRRHVAYGVQDSHYATVGQALLWALGQGLGPSFTPDVEAAWAAAYDMLAGAMQEAAAQVAIPA